MKIKKQIRTCICCRAKLNQEDLLRLQCINKQIVKFTGFNRSFYLCSDCCNNEKKVIKSIYRQCKNKADYENQLKEIVKIWKTK